MLIRLDWAYLKGLKCGLDWCKWLGFIGGCWIDLAVVGGMWIAWVADGFD